MTAFQVLGQALSVEFNEFHREPLVKLFHRFIQLIEARNREEETDFMGQRLGVPLYPTVAFREAIANALVHRDYAKLYAVHVRIDPGRGGLIVNSPGGFVEGVTLENLLSTGPRPRNRTLADAFKHLGLVERTGRGIERIYEDVLGVGRDAPDYSGSNSSTVEVLIPSGDANLEFVKLIAEIRSRTQQPLAWPHLLILRHTADEGELTTSETAKLVQQDEGSARSLLETLVELGLLETKGPKGTRS